MSRLPQRSFAVVLLLLTGCDPPVPTSQPAVELACETRGFPCSLAEVDPNVLRRTEDLSAQLSEMLANGASMADAKAFIAGQEGVAEMHSSPTALCFRLDGGRHAWVVLPEALAPYLDSPSSDAAARTIAPSAAPAAQKHISQNAHVVGDDRDAKHALVLSPFQYEFTFRDDGLAVSQILEKTRGYEGNVTYLENASKGAGTVGIEQFKGWENYDVILVTGHGITLCAGTDCVSMILTGDVYNSVDELPEITDPGVNTVHVAGKKSGKLGLSADFFRFYYSAGLERTIIFFNGCQTYGAGSTDAGSLSHALLGDGSVYLGWSDVVHADSAYVASVGLFSDLADNGVTVQSALDRLGNVAVDAYTAKDGAPIEALLLLDRPADRDLRAREVVLLEQPDGGGELTADASVAAIGKANDGVPDQVPFQVLVDGIEEGQEEAVTVTVSVDGYSSPASAVAAGERVGDHGYRLTGEIPYIDVGTSQTVIMHAAVNLPEGGTSEQTLSITLTADPDGVIDSDGSGSDGDGGGAAREVWIGTADSVLTLILSDGTVTLSAEVTFVQTEYSVGKPTKRLEATGGRLFWTRSGTIHTVLDGDCHYSAGPIEIPIEANDGEIFIDTTTTPHTYWMHGHTPGPDVKVGQNCGSYAFSTSAGGSWLPPLSDTESFTMSPDGGLIAGSTSDSHEVWTWSFQRQ